MKNLFLILAIISSSFSCLFAQDNKGNGELICETLTHNNVEYTYYLYKPLSLPDNAPVVLVFHGYGSDRFPGLDYGINPVADKYNFAVCYPVGPKDFKGQHCWDVGYSFHKENNWCRDDIGFTLKLVEKLSANHKLSNKNVFVTGHSNGGEMSYLLAYTHPHKFAAFAPISGLTMTWMYKHLKAHAPVPLMEVHGTDDVVSKWNGDPLNKDGWGSYIAVPCAVSHWAVENRCTHIQTDTLPIIRNKVITHKYVNGINGTQVWLYEIVGGGHAWPNKDLNTAEHIWKFFSMYLK